MIYLKQVTQTSVTLANQPGNTAELKRQTVKHLTEIDGAAFFLVKIKYKLLNLLLLLL